MKMPRDLPNLTRLQQAALQNRVFKLQTVALGAVLVEPAVVIIGWEWAKRIAVSRERIAAGPDR